MKVVLIGLSVTSSWGNGHATNYRALMRALADRGHDVLFLERDKPWYADNRDLAQPPWGRTVLYDSIHELQSRHEVAVKEADLVVVGSYVPEGRAVGRWALDTATGVTAFYDIDTPVTLAAVARGDCDYVDAGLIGEYDLYLSFTGGPTLQRLADRYGSRRPVAFYCLVDDEAYQPQHVPIRWDLGYLGTYSDDRQPTLDRLLLEPARRRPDLRFVVAGPQYPASIDWPGNVERIEHLPPAQHPGFYAAQRWTLNVTRADMVRAGWSPSVRLFEAAACGVPIISDRWAGIDSILVPGAEIELAADAGSVLKLLDSTDEAARRDIAAAARRRVLAEHTAARRVEQIEQLVGSVRGERT